MRWLWTLLLAVALCATGVWAKDGFGPPHGGPGISSVIEDDISVSCTYDSAHGKSVTAEVYALANGRRVPYIQAAPVLMSPGANQTLQFKIVAHIGNVKREGIETQQLEFVLRDAKGNEFCSVKYPWLVTRPRGWPSYWFDDKVEVQAVQSPSDSEIDVTVYYQNFGGSSAIQDKSLCIYVLKGALRIPWIGSVWVPCQAGRHIVVIPVKLGTPCPAPLDNPHNPAPGPVQTTGFQVDTVARASDGLIVTAGSFAYRDYAKSWPAPPPTQLRLSPEKLRPVIKK